MGIRKKNFNLELDNLSFSKEQEFNMIRIFNFYCDDLFKKSKLSFNPIKGMSAIKGFIDYYQDYVKEEDARRNFLRIFDTSDVEDNSSESLEIKKVKLINR